MSSSTLLTIQNQINLYGYSTLIIFGTFGNVFNVILFNRQRQSACTIYLRTSAAINIFYLIYSGLSRTLSSYNGDITIGALVLCKSNSYISSTFGQVHKTMLVLASIDRFLITSDRPSFRAMSTPKRAKYLIFFSFIFWLVIGCHIPIMQTIINGQCGISGIYSTIFSIYSILFTGSIPPILASTFGYLTYRNMKHRHVRVQPTDQNAVDVNNSTQQRDRDLFIIVISEIVVYVVTVAPFPLVILEIMISQYAIPNKTRGYIEIEIFTRNLALLILAINSATAFYVYFITSKTFRRDFKQLILKICGKIGIEPIIPTVSNTQNRTVAQQESRV